MEYKFKRNNLKLLYIILVFRLRLFYILNTINLKKKKNLV